MLKACLLSYHETYIIRGSTVQNLLILIDILHWTKMRTKKITKMHDIYL